jgi:hypothetical protein
MKENSKNKKPILVRIAEQLVKDQEELDALAVQVSLGKLEAKDKIAEVKKELNSKVHELKLAFKKDAKVSEEKAKLILDKFDKLDQELASDAQDFFKTTKSAVLDVIADIDHDLKNNESAKETQLLFEAYINKAKTQFELLEKHVEGKAQELESVYTEEKEKAKAKANETLEKVKDQKDEAEVRFELFKEEMDLVYKHFKKAVDTLK